MECQGDFSAEDIEKVETIVKMIRELCPHEGWTEEDVTRVIQEAHKATDGNYGEKEAKEWGADFEWPSDIRLRDEQLARECGFSVEVMARAQHETMKKERLSRERINKVVPDNDPDKQRLEDLVEGMRVLTADDFKPSGEPPRIRNLYKRVKGAVNKVLAEMWKEGLVFIVSKETAVTMAEQHGPMQFNTVSWASKKDKKAGRNICDSSDDSGGVALNSEQARMKLEEMYGEINHPTLEDLMGMVNGYADTMRQQMGDEFKWEDLQLWKGDLRKAFTLLNVRPDGVKLFACELTDNLVLFYHTGLFGWTGTPYCFQVITRVVERLVQAGIKGRMKMFVDDGMGVTLRQFLQHDMEVMDRVCKDLLGPMAIAADKWESGRRLTWIGWIVDLDQKRVTISRRNFLKTLYGFFSVDMERVQVKDVERLASWASRYTTILRVMEPFSQALYAEETGMRNRHVYKAFKGIGGRVAVWMWRAMLCLQHLNEETFGRTFDSFRERAADFLLEYDASLGGLGLCLTDLRTGKLLGVGAMRFPFDLGEESRWQNTAEFMAVVMGLVSLVRLGYSSITIKLKGDNISSLRWGSKEHFSSRLCFKAALVYIMMAVAFDMRVVEAEHVPGKDNGFCDALSRGSSPESLGVAACDVLPLEGDRLVRGALHLCDPTEEVQGLESFTSLWRGVSDIINEIRTMKGVKKKRRARDWM